MQYIAIKQEIKQGEPVYLVSAISLKNKNKSIVQKIPHPLGTDSLIFKTLEEAKTTITRAGFLYILPNGQKEIQVEKQKNIPQTSNEYEKMIFEAIKDKIHSRNSNVSASAILAISEFPKEETFEILFEKIGEENDQIRKNAISGICRYGKILQERIINSLYSENWICRNSAITCIINLLDNENIDLEQYITPLIKITNDVNPIVQSSALNALALVYQQYQKVKKI